MVGMLRRARRRGRRRVCEGVVEATATAPKVGWGARGGRGGAYCPVGVLEQSDQTAGCQHTSIDCAARDPRSTRFGVGIQWGWEGRPWSCGKIGGAFGRAGGRSEEHTSELQSPVHLV